MVAEHRMVDGLLNKMSRLWILDSVTNDSRGDLNLQNMNDHKLVG